MKIEDISREWAVDCQIDRNNLQVETLRSSNLHQKYLEMFMSCKQKLMRYAAEYEKMKDLRSRYYQGTLSKDELDERGWVQYQGLKPLKTDMQVKLDGDSELQLIKLKVQYVEAMHTQLEMILNQIKGRDWAIKNHIELLKFMDGG